MGKDNNLFEELKRRNVFRVGAAYVVVSWILTQVVTSIEEPLGLPEWFDTSIIVFVAIGFPIALLFAWAFELTPEGVKKTAEVETEASVTAGTGRKLDFAIISLLVLALGYFIWESRFAETPPEDSEDTAALSKADKSIAVLPFVNLSSDPEQEYFSDGMTEEILNALAKIRELNVAARTSAFAYKGRNLDLRTVGQQLGVRHILEGSVRKAGNTVRITAQLIQADTGFHLWSETYDRELENIFAIQEEISLAIAGALSLTLNIAESPVIASRTDNTEAYDLYLRGLALYRGRRNMDEAVALLQRAVDLDPGFAPAWATLAQTLLHLPIYAGATREISSEEYKTLNDKAKIAAMTAYELAPNLPRALHAMGDMSGTSVERHQFYLKALEIDPSSSEIMEDLAGINFVMGLTQEAVTFAERAVALDPIAVNMLAHGMALAGNGDYDDATAQFSRAAAIAPELGPILWFGLEIFLLTGDLDGMDAHINRFENSLPEPVAEFREFSRILRQHITEHGGFTADLLDKLDRDRRTFAITALIGDADKIIEFGVDRYKNGRVFGTSWAFNDPRFAPLRQSSGFHDALRERDFQSFWQEFGYPKNCHPVGDNDFKCE